MKKSLSEGSSSNICKLPELHAEKCFAYSKTFKVIAFGAIFFTIPPVYAHNSTVMFIMQPWTAFCDNSGAYVLGATTGTMARKPNTIVLGAASEPGTSGQTVVIKDSFLGNAIIVNYVEGERNFTVLLNSRLLADGGRIEIAPSSSGSLPLLRLDTIKAMQNVNMDRFPSGTYVLRIFMGDVLSTWTVVIV